MPHAVLIGRGGKIVMTGEPDDVLLKALAPDNAGK
jgi:hypothetical protein